MVQQSISHRIAAIQESATIAMADRSRAYRARGIDVINLSLGEPDFATPNYICEAAKKAIDQGSYFSYSPVAGYPDLREALAHKYTTDNNVPYEAKNIVVSNGAKQSIANALFSLLNPNDEVIVFSPFWVSYDALIRMTEAVPVLLKGTIENDFKPTAEALEKAVTPATRAIIFSSPCNPTGSVFTPSELEAIATVVRKYDNIIVIADEIYEHINFLGTTVSIASLPGMMERTVTINGFSKAFAMTGWRVGYMAAPEWIVKTAVKVQSQITSGNCSIAQRAALAALQGGLDETYKMKKEYQQRRDKVYALLKDIQGIKVNHPDGAFYFFPDVSAYYNDKTGFRGGEDFCTFALDKAHVSLVPGTPFGDEKCIRLSYAASEENLHKAITRLKEALLTLI